MDLVNRYQTEIEKLFQEWKEKLPSNEIDHKNGVFIRDGIVCPKLWFAQKVRPLFLLKEAFHGSGDWDLIHDHLLGSGKIGRGTWRRVSEWAYGLMNTTENIIPPFPADETMSFYGNPYLRQIAVVNVKKSNGASNSSMEQINQYAEYDRLQLRRELELIAPTVIVCGYTISSLNIIMEKSIKDYQQTNPNLYYFMELNGHDVVVLDYYHPSNRYPAILNYYGLMGIYQQALTQRSKGRGTGELA